MSETNREKVADYLFESLFVEIEPEALRRAWSETVARILDESGLVTPDATADQNAAIVAAVKALSESGDPSDWGEGHRDAMREVRDTIKDFEAQR